MSDMPWVRFFPSDWLGGTRSLSAAETGIYITLVATMYERSAPLAFDHAKLARLCGASNSTFKAALASLIADGKILNTPEGLWNERVGKEVVYRQEKSEVGFQAAKARWTQKPNEINASANADAMPSQSERNANQKPEPDTRKKEEDTSLRSVGPAAPKPTAKSELMTVLDAEHAQDVIDHRNKIKSPMTPKAGRMLAAKLASFPSPNDAADFMIERGWKSIEPSWVDNHKARGSPQAQPGPPRNIFEASTQLLNELKAAENDTRPDQIDSRPQPPLRHITAAER